MESAIERLKSSGEAVVHEVAEITDAQWNWRAEEGRWTVQENVEHLILVERGLLLLLRRATGERPKEPLTDNDLWDRLTGPGRARGQAPERVRPSGTWADRKNALAEFERLRRETIAYALTTEDPLRERWMRLPVGELDGVQVLLMMAGHSMAHLDQIRALRRDGPT